MIFSQLNSQDMVGWSSLPYLVHTFPIIVPCVSIHSPLNLTFCSVTNWEWNGSQFNLIQFNFIGIVLLTKNTVSKQLYRNVSIPVFKLF